MLDGPTLVVSPLLALIEDQVGKLKAAGVAVARIDSTRTAKERAADLEAVREGKIKLVIITPESVNSPVRAGGARGGEVLALLRRRGALRVAVGPRLPSVLPGAAARGRGAGAAAHPGLTATATPAIADDVLVQLGMKDAKVCRVSFHRPNLAFDVRKVAGEARQAARSWAS